jgi:hypothetical protein
VVQRASVFASARRLCLLDSVLYLVGCRHGRVPLFLGCKEEGSRKPEKCGQMGRTEPAVLCRRGNDRAALIPKGKMAPFNGENRSLGRQHGTRHEVVTSGWRRMTLAAYGSLAVEGEPHPIPREMGGQRR